jgi:hypothetical protein
VLGFENTVFLTKKTDFHDIIEILLEVVLNTIIVHIKLNPQGGNQNTKFAEDHYHNVIVHLWTLSKFDFLAQLVKRHVRYWHPSLSVAKYFHVLIIIFEIAGLIGTKLG